MPKQARPSMLLRAFRVPAELWEQVEAWAEARGVNPSAAVREALERLVNDGGRED